MNTITCHKTQHQGLPTEYYFPKQKVTVFNPQQVVDQIQAQWPALKFEIKYL